MTLSLRDLLSLSEAAEFSREALVVQLEARLGALTQSRLRHQERLSQCDRKEIQQVLDRGHMDLRKSPAILVETTRYVDRFHHHILLKLAMA
ncbi:MAG: iron-sulfur cluster repair protein YtfE (RIC family) [Myxococcota bacterium]|jgi:iron-sulfur cluster repair protein YtfE (RIC family)